MKVKDIKPRRAADVNEEVKKAWKEAYPKGVFVISVNTDEVISTNYIADKKGKKSSLV